MSRVVIVLLALALSLFVSACKQDGGVPLQSSQSTPSSATATKVAVSAAPEKPADALASTNTNFGGVVADVTEFRRKGSVLTALVRLRNQGTGIALVDIGFADSYVMDAGSKKYQVLKDEEGAFIASPRVGDGLVDGGTRTLWMKFPAPPPELRKATLVLPGMPPFEDLPIQD
jgi:hypothetical protein